MREFSCSSIGNGLNSNQLGRRITSFGTSFSELVIRPAIPRNPRAESRRGSIKQSRLETKP